MFCKHFEEILREILGDLEGILGGSQGDLEDLVEIWSDPENARLPQKYRAKR
jgi:hypothetical protein